MASHYLPLIIDIGPILTQGGVAGDIEPISTVESKQKNLNGSSIEQYPPIFEIDHYSLDLEQKLKLYNTIKENELYSRLTEQYSLEISNWLDYNDKIVLQIKLDQLFTDITLNPRSCKVIVIDRNFSNVTKLNILDVLINKILVKSVIFQPEPILSLIGANVENGIVINLDWDVSSVHAVVNLRLISQRDLSAKYSGMGLHYLVVHKLLEAGLDASFDLVRRLISTSYVEGYKPEHFTEDPPLSLELVQDVLDELYFKLNNIVDMIKKIVDESSIDNRKLLLENIIFTGDVVKIPGLKLKLLDLIKKLLKVEGTFTLGPWCGCSLYVSTKLIYDDKAWSESQYTREILLRLITSNGYRLAGLK